MIVISVLYINASTSRSLVFNIVVNWELRTIAFQIDFQVSTIENQTSVKYPKEPYSSGLLLDMK